MSRTYGLRTAQDLLSKLDRDAMLLREQVSSDHFFNFFVTAYSLADWVQNDPSVPASAKNALKQFRGKPEIQICKDLANASKHFELDPKKNPTPMVDSADSAQGYGVGRYGIGDYGVGEESIVVRLSAGSPVDGMDVMEEALREWKAFFHTHGI